MKNLALFVSILVISSGVGCGDSSSDDGGGPAVSCDVVEACGGDLVGDWVAAATCGFSSTQNDLDGCVGSSIVLDASVSGTVSFKSDGTFTRDQEFSITSDITVPKMCLPGGDCAEVGEGCTDANNVCRCSASDSEDDSGEGTFVVNDDNTFSATEGAGTDEEDTDTLAFCVQGDTLTLLVEDEEGQPLSIVYVKN